MKLRDTLLIAVLALVILGPAGMYVLRGAGAALPESLDPAAADYLAGGKTEVDLGDSLSAEAFLSGKLQSDIGVAVENNIPAKATALFANAAWQRSAIQASNALFGWPCFQTYFNSEYLLVPEYDAIVQSPYTGGEMADGLTEFAEEANSYAARHPELDIELVVVDRACTSASNPASKLVNDPFTTQRAVDIMRASCIEENVRVASVCYQEAKEFFEDFYRSDHHWNTRGVLKGVRALCEGMDDDDPARDPLESIEAAGIRRAAGPQFSGSCTRNGLYAVEEDPLDFAYDFSSLRIFNNGEEIPANVHSVYDQASELNMHYQFYDLYYRGGEKFLGPGCENALLISDSFGSAFQWPLAAAFSTLWTSNSLHYYSESSDSLNELCDLPSCSKVVFVGCVLNYSNFLERNPNAFK